MLLLPSRIVRSSAAPNALRAFSSLPPRLNRSHNNETRNFTPVPYITETIGGGWRTSDIFSKLLQERIILINGEITDTLSSTTIAQLLYLESTSPASSITLYINSPGGSVTSGLAIYDTMRYIRSPVSTVCVGQAASMGSLLLCGGEEGKRFCLPNSSIMVHQPSGGYFGQASDIAIHAQEILRVRARLNEIYRKHLTRVHSVEEIEKLMERDRFLSAEEAVEMGIVDEVLVRRGDEGEGEGEAEAEGKIEGKEK